MRTVPTMPFKIRPLWWLGQVVLVLMTGLFLVFGVQLLMAAYELPDPFSFIMTFFAASLIILISLALLAGFLLRLYSVYRYLRTPGRQAPPETPDETAPAPQTDPSLKGDERSAQSPRR